MLSTSSVVKCTKYEHNEYINKETRGKSNVATFRQLVTRTVTKGKCRNNWVFFN